MKSFADIKSLLQGSGRHSCIAMVAFGLLVGSQVRGDDAPTGQQLNLGPMARQDFFPIAVWLQQSFRAQRFQAAGFNMYIGLYPEPSESELVALKNYNMPIICQQNSIALNHKNDPNLIGWMQQPDEPDAAQLLPGGTAYGPPITPEVVVSKYNQMRQNDPTRPVFLNLSPGVIWDNWRGRGTRTGHNEDYPLYIQGCDIISFDIYPAAAVDPAIAGKIWMIPDGVTRLKQWSAGQKILWNYVECTAILDKSAKATPDQVRAEVWMSIIRGSQGIIYFVHQMRPSVVEAALLFDPVMLPAVTKINQQVQSLASVINSPTIANGVTVQSSNTAVPVEALVKRFGNATYVFVAPFRPGVTNVRLQLPNRTGVTRAEVLGESRTLDVNNGVFRDRFDSWNVHLYCIPD